MRVVVVIGLESRKRTAMGKDEALKDVLIKGKQRQLRG